jgi:transcriptional regulator with PAS, ATPase and Fis domain
VHKDAFIEIKQKVAQQTEFQTIFDELDESVVILNVNKRIVQFNQKYRKSIFAIFGESITTKVVEYTKLYERFENEKTEEMEYNKKSKGEKCCSFICCWRPNKKPKINLLDD